MQSTQVNFRIPNQLKIKAQQKADCLGLNLSEVMKLFLEKFTNENVLKVQIKHDVAWEKVFDQGVLEYFMSKKGKETTQAINKLLKNTA